MAEITDFQLDALKELINIGIGRSSSILNEMIESHIDLQVPEIKLLSKEDFLKESERFGQDKISSIILNFKGKMIGSALLLFSSESATKLVEVLTGEKNDPELLKNEVLMEIGNIVLNGIVGSIGNFLDKKIIYSIPIYEELNPKSFLDLIKFERSPLILLVRTHFKSRNFQIEGEIILTFELISFESILDSLNLFTFKNDEN